MLQKRPRFKRKFYIVSLLINGDRLALRYLLFAYVRLTSSIKGEEILLLFLQKVSYEKYFLVW